MAMCQYYSTTPVGNSSRRSVPGSGLHVQREERQVTGGVLLLEEAGEGVIGVFMWRDGRQVTGGELHLETAGERIDDEVPGTFMWREGRQGTGRELEVSGLW